MTPSACRPRTTRSRRACTRAISTAESIASFQRQFRSWGISIDWSRELATHEPQLLPLDAVDLPRAVPRRPRLPQGGGGQVVPERPDGARQRAGRRRRPLRALRRARRSAASSSSGSCGSPTTPSGCSATSTRSTGPSTSRRCSATGSAAARAPRSRSAARSSGSTTRCSRRARTRCSARPSS